MIITPLVSVLLTSFITFTVIEPIMRVIGDGMTNGVLWLFFDLGPLGSAIYGVVYPLLVITGMHHSMAAAEMQILANISKLGGSPTFAVVSASNVAQGPAGISGVIVMRPQSMIQFLVSITISFVVTFIVTYLFVKIFNRKGGKNNGVA